MDYKEYFRGKKITVMGLGLLGRGLGDVKFLADCGANLIVTDLKRAVELRPTLRKLEKFKDIKYVLGEHRPEDFRNRDMILKAAGVPLNSPYIKEAKKNKIPVEMDESLFFKLAPKDVVLVGVTGTRGKTTVATLIYEILKHAREKLSWDRKIYLAGNIKGVATLPFLSKIQSGDMVVAELSSWQLQGFGESKTSPHIAVFTNFLDDHLNYYKDDRKKYFKDKSYIYKYQKKGDFLVVSEQALKYIRGTKDRPTGKIVAPKTLPASFKTGLSGNHNRINVSLAVEVAKILGVEEKIVREAVRDFRGVPGRQELVLKAHGIEIYNDTTSTTPDSIAVALESFGKKRNVVLIMGGTDKGLDVKEIFDNINKYCKTVVLLPGTGTEKFKKQINKIKNKSLPIIETKNLKEAIREALKGAKRGDRIIFSPGFTSFGMFKNEYDRGEKFDRELAKVKKDLPKILGKGQL